MILAGRGFGKTRSGAEFIQGRVDRGEAKLIALVAATAPDARDTMVRGPSGLLLVAPPWNRPRYEPSKRRLTWPNGAEALLFSAEEPERLRGPQFDTAWCDELGAWKYQRETWDQLAFGFRSGEPRGCITTTPRPTEVVRELLRDPDVVVSRGSTYDNAANLAGSFLRRVLAKYEGTRLGRQELLAEILSDTPGALWTLTLLDRNRYRERRAPDCARIAVAIDPQASDPSKKSAADEDGAETGIIAAGVDADGVGYVLRDATGRFTPAEWGEAAVLLFDELRADFIVAEVNNGGAMVEHVVRSAAQKLYREKKRSSPHIAYRAVHASRGKHTRAEPIAALDEQGRIRHVGTFPALEDQMTTWVPGQKSPDRMDARVWAFTALMLDSGPPASYADEAAAIGEVPRGQGHASGAGRSSRDDELDRDPEDDDDPFNAPRRS